MLVISLKKRYFVEPIDLPTRVNLLIDQGNTVCKVAVAAADALIADYVLPELTLRKAKEILAKHPGIERAIYSSVARVDTALLAFLTETLGCVRTVDQCVSVPLEIDYDRSRLGSDRLAAVVGAYALVQPGVPCLVIDLGTAVTFEYIDAEGVYRGGNISPGIFTRLKSLNHFTSRLPLVTDLDAATDLFGRDTRSAIASGVLHGVAHEIVGYIYQLSKKNSQLAVYLTGGDAPLVVDALPESVIHEPHLVLYGLNKILEYNK